MGCACGKGRRATAASPASRVSGPTGGTKSTVYTVAFPDGTTEEYTDPGRAATDARARGGTMTAVRK